ncbi:MAG: hypothetical protein IJ513_01840, partial [Bacteroidaceae bacterium]|nr:hypothetical protein [Bacteroidaceae bacterium]
FVPRGLRQDSIINGSLFHYNRKYFVKPHLFATDQGLTYKDRRGRQVTIIFQVSFLFLASYSYICKKEFYL